MQRCPIDARHVHLARILSCERDELRYAGRRRIDLAELIDEPWILPPAGTWYHAFVSQLFRARGLDVPRPSFITHSIALRTQLMIERRYLTTFARSIVRFNAKRYALKILPVDVPRQPLPAGALTLKNRMLSPVVERFIAVAREVAKQLAAR